MAKTKKQIIEDLKLVDIVIELLDARIPISSQNPNIGEITKNKKKIVVLNKSDLADENQNNLWVEYFKNKQMPAVIVDANSGKGIENCIKEIEKIMNKQLEEIAQKGRTGRRIRAMILGIPNVGKSSFINRISKRTTAGVGNRPGITRQKQWIRINEKIELLDTPGVLWPKFESEEVALNLSYIGSIKDTVIPQTEVAYQLLKFLLKNYKENIIERYKLTDQYIETVLSKPEPENVNIYEIMQEIGRKRGQIISGGEVDDEKTSRIILDDFRTGKIGNITLEKAERK